LTVSQLGYTLLMGNGGVFLPSDNNAADTTINVEGSGVKCIYKPGTTAAR
jgi:hypothetical protein